MIGGDVGCWIAFGSVVCRTTASRVEARGRSWWDGVLSVLTFSINEEEDDGDDAEENTGANCAAYDGSEASFRTV